jgi:hypothetical protein
MGEERRRDGVSSPLIPGCGSGGNTSGPKTIAPTPDRLPRFPARAASHARAGCYGPAGGPPGGGAGPGGGAAPGASGAQAADRLPPSDSYSSLGFSYL